MVEEEAAITKPNTWGHHSWLLFWKKATPIVPPTATGATALAEAGATAAAGRRRLAAATTTAGKASAGAEAGAIAGTPTEVELTLVEDSEAPTWTDGVEVRGQGAGKGWRRTVQTGTWSGWRRAMQTHSSAAASYLPLPSTARCTPHHRLCSLCACAPRWRMSLRRAP